MQLVIPLLVGAFLLYTLLWPRAAEHVQWGNLCRVGFPRTGGQIFRKVVNRLVSAILLFYIYNFMHSQLYLMQQKPARVLLKDSLAFHPRIMPEAKWSVLGVVFNILSLSICGALSIIVIYVTEEPLEIVLNALAIFFLLEVDNILVDKPDFKANMPKLQGCLERSDDDPSLPVVVHFDRFLYSVRAAEVFSGLVLRMLLVSPVYVLVCK